MGDLSNAHHFQSTFFLLGATPLTWNETIKKITNITFTRVLLPLCPGGLLPPLLQRVLSRVDHLLYLHVKGTVSQDSEKLNQFYLYLSVRTYGLEYFNQFLFL
jgi:hypothetical protein